MTQRSKVDGHLNNMKSLWLVKLIKYTAIATYGKDWKKV